MSEPSTTPKKLSPEHRAKLSEVQRRRWAAGRTVSDETRARQAEAAAGHEVSDQTREKITKAAIRREARRRGELPAVQVTDEDLVVERAWPAVLSVPGRADFHAAVLVEGEGTWYIGRDAFATEQDALMVAVRRARARMEDADGHR